MANQTKTMEWSKVGEEWLSKARANLEQRYGTRTLPFSGNTPLTARTSQSAANLLGNARSLRRKVFLAIKAAPDGLTDSEIQTRLGMNGNTQRPRRLELQADGLIESRLTRRQDNNRLAAVWTVTAKGNKLDTSPHVNA